MKLVTVAQMCDITPDPKGFSVKPGGKFTEISRFNISFDYNTCPGGQCQGGNL